MYVYIYIWVQRNKRIKENNMETTMVSSRDFSLSWDSGLKFRISGRGLSAFRFRIEGFSGLSSQTVVHSIICCFLWDS